MAQNSQQVVGPRSSDLKINLYVILHLEHINNLEFIFYGAETAPDQVYIYIYMAVSR